MRSNPTERPDERAIVSVLDWLEERLANLGRTEASGAGQRASAMLRVLREGAHQGRLALAWTSHGLGEPGVGPVLLMLSDDGALLISLSPGRAGNGRGAGSREPEARTRGETTRPW